jgi:hypothetical protein
MQVFRTILSESPQGHAITHADQVFQIGSCFTDHISDRLKQAGFRVTKSPFGTVYNPVSISDGLLRLVRGEKFAEGALICTHELWHTWQHHGAAAGTDKGLVLKRINEDFDTAFGKLLTANWLIITVGSANVYTLVESGQIVANCHKAPSSLFKKRMLTVEEVETSLSTAIAALTQFNPGLKVMLTISPVKHLRDGMVENLRSKSTLILACAALAQRFEHVHYSPIYELITEELRDYRFYASDMCHPNGTAIDYVWQWFQKTYFGADTQLIADRAMQLNRALAHRPLHAETQAHQAFLTKTQKQIATFRSQYPHIEI